MEVYRYGEVIVEIDDDRQRVVTRFPDGESLVTANRDDQDAMAASLGYEGPWELNRMHDPMHSWLADQLGLPYSPTLHGVARSAPASTELATSEEAAVLALQRYVNALSRASGLPLDWKLRAGLPVQQVG